MQIVIQPARCYRRRTHAKARMTMRPSRKSVGKCKVCGKVQGSSPQERYVSQLWHACKSWCIEHSMTRDLTFLFFFFKSVGGKPILVDLDDVGTVPERRNPARNVSASAGIKRGPQFSNNQYLYFCLFLCASQKPLGEAICYT